MIDDEQLAQAAAELANAIYESTPTSEVPAHQFSKRFEKKMSRLIQKANHPILYKFLHAVACFLLVMTISGCCVWWISTKMTCRKATEDEMWRLLM